MLWFQNIRHFNDSGISPLFRDYSLERLCFQMDCGWVLHSLDVPVPLLFVQQETPTCLCCIEHKRHPFTQGNALHCTKSVSTVSLKSLRVKSRESLSHTSSNICTVYAIGIRIFLHFYIKAWGFQMHSNHFHQETEKIPHRLRSWSGECRSGMSGQKQNL